MADEEFMPWDGITGRPWNVEHIKDEYPEDNHSYLTGFAHGYRDLIDKEEYQMGCHDPSSVDSGTAYNEGYDAGYYRQQINPNYLPKVAPCPCNTCTMERRSTSPDYWERKLQKNNNWEQDWENKFKESSKEWYN